jgi:ABC-type transport system involved in cytochrome c biogenesis permease component
VTGPQHRPNRERVVLAERRGARRVRTRVEVAEQTEIGEAMIGGLIRAQLGLALRLSLVTVLVLCSLPLLFRIGAIGSFVIVGIRLPWLLLGVVVYPLLYAVGRLYVRLAEHNEQDFLELADE